ncbi:MAG: hypothetical protein KAG61_12060 [Bacteriovoracaceae bacterium]|nr:hypothetical protein [Bacteriovoracaceae bacterium]
MKLLLLIVPFILACNIERPAEETSRITQKLQFTHTLKEKNCAVCHENSRPEIKVIPNWDYKGNKSKYIAAGGHYESMDCTECHVTDTWKFKHSDSRDKNISYCIDCHHQRGWEAQSPRPKWHQRGNWYNHEGEWDEADEGGFMKGGGTCYRCHGVRRSWKRGKGG